jgi:hypothetical protein
MTMWQHTCGVSVWRSVWRCKLDVLKPVYFSLSYDRGIKLNRLLCAYGHLGNDTTIAIYRAKAVNRIPINLSLTFTC